MLHRSLTLAHLLEVISFQTFDSVPFFFLSVPVSFVLPRFVDDTFNCKRGPDRRNTPHSSRTCGAPTCAPWSFRDLKGRESEAPCIPSRTGGAPTCAPWSPVSRPQGERIASSLHSFADPWCSNVCSLVPSFETSRGGNRKLSAFLRASVVLHHVLPGPQVRDLKGRESQAPCILRATVLHHLLPGPQVRDLKGRESQAPRILRASVVLHHVLPVLGSRPIPGCALTSSTLAAGFNWGPAFEVWSTFLGCCCLQVRSCQDTSSKWSRRSLFRPVFDLLQLCPHSFPLLHSP